MALPMPFCKLRRHLNFDGTNLEVSYVISGGLRKHIPEILVSLQKGEYGFHAVVQVFDVSDKPDYAEGLLYPSTKVDLKQLILQEAIKNGYEVPYNVDVEFPHVFYPQ